LDYSPELWDILFQLSEAAAVVVNSESNGTSQQWWKIKIVVSWHEEFWHENKFPVKKPFNIHRQPTQQPPSSHECKYLIVIMTQFGHFSMSSHIYDSWSYFYEKKIHPKDKHK
jgi:hypothetical protein